jgi:hypothetical protein
MAGQSVEVIGLVVGQAQGACQRPQHLRRRLCAPRLLEPAVVVHRHPRQLSHLLASQPRGAAANAWRQSDIRRRDRLAAEPKKLRQRMSIHPSIVANASRPQPETVSPWFNVSWSPVVVVPTLAV